MQQKKCIGHYSIGLIWIVSETNDLRTNFVTGSIGNFRYLTKQFRY